MIATLCNTTDQHPTFVPRPLFGTPQGQTQGSQFGRADVAEFHALEVVPQPFDRIEFGSMGRQLLQMQPLGCPSSEEILDELPAAAGWLATTSGCRRCWQVCISLLSMAG